MMLREASPAASKVSADTTLTQKEFRLENFVEPELHE
jgi:hypothetical protein